MLVMYPFLVPLIGSLSVVAVWFIIGGAINLVDHLIDKHYEDEFIEI